MVLFPLLCFSNSLFLVARIDYVIFQNTLVLVGVVVVMIT